MMRRARVPEGRHVCPHIQIRYMYPIIRRRKRRPQEKNLPAEVAEQLEHSPFDRAPIQTILRDVRHDAVENGRIAHHVIAMRVEISVVRHAQRHLTQFKTMRQQRHTASSNWPMPAQTARPYWYIEGLGVVHVDHNCTINECREPASQHFHRFILPELLAGVPLRDHTDKRRPR